MASALKWAVAAAVVLSAVLTILLAVPWIANWTGWLWDRYDRYSDWVAARKR